MDVEDHLGMFGLDREQQDILYSIEAVLVQRDAIGDSKKEDWLQRWQSVLEETDGIRFCPELEILDRIRRCDDGIDRIWYHLVMMEASLFVPYFPLGADPQDKEAKKRDRRYAKLQYAPQTGYLEQLARDSGLMDPIYIKRFQKTYKKAYSRISGGMKDFIIKGSAIVASAGLIAATAGALAGPVAVALVGSNFTGLSGAALVSASLAYIGGGAIAVGGSGMAGGVAAIVGGGALLGAAGGGAMVSAVGAISKDMPGFTLSQAAKLDVVLREILLNSQADVRNAQVVMAKLREKIGGLQKQLDDLELARKKDKEQIDALKKAVQYMRRAYKDMDRFQSSYEMGRTKDRLSQRQGSR